MDEGERGQRLGSAKTDNDAKPLEQLVDLAPRIM